MPTSRLFRHRGGFVLNRLACFSLLGILSGTCAFGCLAITRLDRFSEVDPSGATDATDASSEGGGVDDPTRPSSLRLTLRDMGFHLNKLIEFRVIDNQNTIQTRGFIFPLDRVGSQSVTVNLPNALPLDNRPYRLDLYGDVNNSGDYDGIGDVLRQDHAWRISPLVDTPAGAFPHEANVVQVVFEHNKILTDIDEWPLGTKAPARATGLGAIVRFSGAQMAPYQGKLIQVRIAEGRVSRTVGVYRNPQIPSGDFSAFVGGVLDPEVAYNVDVYVDANGNGEYEDPSGQAQSVDLGWRIPVKATLPDMDAGVDGGAPDAPIGISIDFNPTGSYPSNVDVGPP